MHGFLYTLRFALSLILLVSCAKLFSSTLDDQRYQLKEEVRAPYGWIRLGNPPRSHKIRLRIGLPQLKFGELEKQLFEISDPYHHKYGKHLSKEEVEALVAPHKNSIDVVDKWLKSFGIAKNHLSRSPASDWVMVNISIGLAEEMFNTKYYVWQHVSSGDRLIRTTRYSLPGHLHKHIDVVQPTTIFSRFKAQKSMIVLPTLEAEIVEPNAQTRKLLNAAGASVDATCSKTITISCLLQLYNAVGYTASSDIGNSIGVASYLEEYANLQDLQTFYTDQRPDAVNSTPNFVSVKGGSNNQTLALAGLEANLDAQFAFGISYPVNSTFYSTGGRGEFIPDTQTPLNTNEPFMDWIDYVLSQSDPPLIISTSYGDDEQTVPKSYAERACSGFAQLGTRGVSLLFASGDAGVGDGNPDPTNQTCLTNDGQNKTRFIPSFPASCPYITAVGATTGISPEVAVSRFYSGGGFSNYFLQPGYQKDAVAAYIKILPQGSYQDLYNPQGRAYPDVAAQGDNFKIFYRGRAVLIGGTSASSPAFAGLVALLNDVRLRNNLPPLGFLNPFIYSNGVAGFNDIIVGNAAGCGTPGFNTSIGWDPVTGHGTPNFEKLKDLVFTVNRTTIRSAGSMLRPDNYIIGIVLRFAVMRILYESIRNL